MNPILPFVILHHGTTLKRAERIVKSGPDPGYIEPGGLFYDPAGGFSTGEAGAPEIGLETPEVYARRKAANFLNDGGPVILEIEVPAWIVAIVRNHPDLGDGAASGDIRFEPGVGLEELLQSWPTLTKRIVPL